MRGSPATRRPHLRASVALAALLLSCGGAERGGSSAGPPAIAARVADLLARMTLDEKLGQMAAVDRRALTSDEDIATYALGSVFSGGGATPEVNVPAAWADMVDGYQRVALSSRLGIPILYGVDAVHGHANAWSATVFPHELGLGAARDPELVEEIGRATAEELAATGVAWDFAPSVAVARDERWGRTYESFGEEPDIAASYGGYVTGLQGAALGAGPASVLATAKHWIADGGTAGGVDGAVGGDAPISDAELRAIHLPPFLSALRAGAGAVMVSHNSVDGVPMHANRPLVTDLLKGQLGFDGIVVSDWGGTADISSDYPLAVRSLVNAGVDLVMVPDDYRSFIATLRDEVTAGRVPMDRIDDAVRRILTKKLELGLFERPFADRAGLASVGSAAHRQLARRAVRESLVLLRNDGILPLARTTPRIYVAGKSADDLGNQAGGWTISWQGSSGAIIPGTTVLDAIRTAVAPGTTVGFDRDGLGADGSWDVAVAVVGETPYAEWLGDRSDDLGLDAEDRATLAALARSGVPTVVIVVSGRPLVVTDLLPGWAALVAAWLPGSEGEGITDVLFGDFAPTGTLPISWPRSAAQVGLHRGDAGYDPLFPYGFGLSWGGTEVAAGTARAVRRRRE